MGTKAVVQARLFQKREAVQAFFSGINIDPTFYIPFPLILGVSD